MSYFDPVKTVQLDGASPHQRLYELEVVACLSLTFSVGQSVQEQETSTCIVLFIPALPGGRETLRNLENSPKIKPQFRCGNFNDDCHHLNGWEIDDQNLMSLNGDPLSHVRIERTSPIIRTKQAAREVNSQHVEVLVMGYSDRIMINVTTEGKIGQLVFHWFPTSS